MLIHYSELKVAGQKLNTATRWKWQETEVKITVKLIVKNCYMKGCFHRKEHHQFKKNEYWHVKISAYEKLCATCYSQMWMLENE